MSNINPQTFRLILEGDGKRFTWVHDFANLTQAQKWLRTKMLALLPGGTATIEHPNSCLLISKRGPSSYGWTRRTN